jgi:hypothetical protein
MEAASSSKLFDVTLINDDVETTYSELTGLIARLRPDILGKEVDEQEREKGKGVFLGGEDGRCYLLSAYIAWDSCFLYLPGCLGQATLASSTTTIGLVQLQLDSDIMPLCVHTSS